jgi:prepilin-type N-terminal cleavage/methylation domain-containing protein
MRARGFTLVEIVVVLVIIGLILTMGIKMTGSMLAGQKRYQTRDRMAAVDISLAAFVSQLQRLPCPADGALASSDPNAGLEARDGAGDCGTQARGVVPWRTIGMSEADATDGFLSRITYRVGPGLTRNAAMIFAACDPAGTGGAVGASPACDPTCASGLMAQCTPTQTAMAGRGLQVRIAVGGTVIADPAGTPATGAAYVVISHGENRAGAYSGDGVVQETVGTVGGGETQNAASAALQAYYVDGLPDGTDTASHFDDIVLRPTVLAVATKAGLAPRAH